MKEIFNLKSAKGVLIAAVASILIGAVMILALAWILYTTTVSEKISDGAVAAITVIGNFFAGFISARINKSRGLVFGVLSGILYFVILYVISCFAGVRTDFSAICTITILISLTAAALGGVIGVNIKQKSRKKKR